MIKLFTDIDLDGFGCGIIAKIAFGEKADVSYCSYRNLNQRVEGFIHNTEHNSVEMYITDLAVNEHVEKKLEQRFQEGKHVQMIDHHITAMHFNHYKWGWVKPEYESGKKTCATSLFYDFLIEKGLLEPNHVLEEFIDLVRQYDTWEWDENNNQTAKRLNDLFYILNREKFEEEMLKRLTEDQVGFTLTETENLLLDIEEKKIERYIFSKNRQLIQTTVGDYCIGIVHAEQYLSELGNALNTINPHLDMIILLNVSGKKMGFRTIHEHVNVADFAKRYGGGGHPKASGAELTKEAFEQFVVNVFEVLPMRPDADRNEYNLKNTVYATSYINHRGEISFIMQIEHEQYAVIHAGKKKEQIFTNYEAAERFIKRHYASWLRYDTELLGQISATLQKPLENVREHFSQYLQQYVTEIIKE